MPCLGPKAAGIAAVNSSKGQYRELVVALGNIASQKASAI
jgi:hypothetical protein